MPLWPNRLPTTVACLTASLALSGCVSWSSVHVAEYHGWRAPAVGDPAGRWQAAARLLHDAGFTVDNADREAGMLVAHHEHSATLRDRVALRAEESATWIEYRTEIFDAGQWSYADRVCDTYAFAREKALGSAVDQAAVAAANDPMEVRHAALQVAGR